MSKQLICSSMWNLLNKLDTLVLVLGLPKQGPLPAFDRLPTSVSCSPSLGWLRRSPPFSRSAAEPSRAEEMNLREVIVKQLSEVQPTRRPVMAVRRDVAVGWA